MKEFDRNSNACDKLHHNLLYQKFCSLIHQTACFENVSRVLVGVSGGVDSSVLLHMLCEYQKKQNGPHVIALHIHHAQRAEEADRDEAAARELAKQLGCEFFSVKLDVSSGASEEELRKLRHQALETFAIDQNCERIALGHHMDDQAETFLFRLIRGADIKGLSAMKVFRFPYVRPMLGISRNEILMEAERCQIPFMSDSSNDLNGPARNYIRNVVMPALESKLDPQVKNHMANLAQSMSEIDLYMTTQAVEMIDKVAVSDHSYSVKMLREVLPALRKKMIHLMYAYIIKDKGALSREQVAMIDAWMETTQSPKFLLLPGSIRVEKKQGVLTFSIVGE